MKTLIFTALLVLPLGVQAQDFKFAWTYQGATLRYNTEAKNWETAYKRAVDHCVSFFKDANAEDVIDVCANPKETK